MQYDLDSKIGELAAVLDDYTEWFMLVVRRISYPQHTEEQKHLSKPESFALWMEEAGKSGFKDEAIERLNMLHDDLSQHAGKLISNSLESQQAPEFKGFDKFVTLFEEFLLHVRRLEIDSLLEDSGIDSLTGLRSEAALEKDLGCEMDRLARQGKPFSIALVRIDNFEEMKATGDAKAVIKMVANMVQRSLRSFDDAYRFGENEIVLSLKQADISGGIKALERLKKELLDRDDTDYGQAGLSLSSCVAEPTHGDNVNELIANLHSELDTCDKSESGAILEYFEVSPLQRYVKGGQE